MYQGPGGLPSYGGAKGRFGRSKGPGFGGYALAALVATGIAVILGLTVVYLRGQERELMAEFRRVVDENVGLRNQVHHMESQLSSHSVQSTSVTQQLHDLELRISQLSAEKARLQEEYNRKAQEASDNLHSSETYRHQLEEEVAVHKAREDNWIHLQNEWEALEKEWEAEVTKLRKQIEDAKMKPVVPQHQIRVPQHINPVQPKPVVGSSAGQPVASVPATPTSVPAAQHEQQQQHLQHHDPHTQQQHDNHQQQHDYHHQQQAHGMPTPVPAGQHHTGADAPGTPAHQPPVPGAGHDTWNAQHNHDYFDPHQFYADYPGFVGDDWHTDQLNWEHGAHAQPDHAGHDGHMHGDAHHVDAHSDGGWHHPPPHNVAPGDPAAYDPHAQHHVADDLSIKLGMGGGHPDPHAAGQQHEEQHKGHHGGWSLLGGRHHEDHAQHYNQHDPHAQQNNHHDPHAQQYNHHDPHSQQYSQHDPHGQQHSGHDAHGYTNPEYAVHDGGQPAYDPHAHQYQQGSHQAYDAHGQPGHGQQQWH